MNDRKSRESEPQADESGRTSSPIPEFHQDVHRDLTPEQATGLSYSKLRPVQGEVNLERQSILTGRPELGLSVECDGKRNRFGVSLYR